MLLAARYVLPVSSAHIVDGAVLVRDGRIVEVGTRAELVAKHPEEELRDFGLAALMPGFIDLHTHLEFAAFRGLVDDLPYTQWKMQVLRKERAFDRADWDESAMLGALEAIQSGITTIADITETGASARAAAATGLRGVVYREVSTMEKSKVDDVMARAEEDIAAWEEYSPQRLRIGIAPHATYSCHPTLFSAVAEKACREGLPVATHLAGSRDEFEFIKYGSSQLAVDYRDMSGWHDVVWLPTGVSPIRYVLQWGLFDVPQLLAVHCVQVDPSDIEVLAGHGVSVAHCPRCNAKLGMGIAPLGKFLEAGVCVGLGTDSPAASSTVDFFDEMRVGILVQRSITAEAEFFTAQHFIRLATLEAARALGMDAEVGSLEPGKQADIVAVDLSSSHQLPTQDPYSALVHTANQENIAMTMVAGQVLYDAGAYLTTDAAPILERIPALRDKLRA